MYNWDDPIKEALNKPEPKSTDSTKAEEALSSESLQEGLTGIEDIEQGAGRIRVDDKAIINSQSFFY